MFLLASFLVGGNVIPIRRNQHWNSATSRYNLIFGHLDRVHAFLKANEKKEKLREVNLTTLKHLDEAIALSEENLKDLKKLRKEMRGK
jgi:hypothetical protein